MAFLLFPLLILVQHSAAAPHPHPIGIDVFLSGSDTPIVAKTLDRLWVDGAAVARIECRFDRRDGAASMQASASRRSWSFLAHENEPRAVLTVTEEIRDAWIEEGKLSVARVGNRGRPAVRAWFALISAMAGDRTRVLEAEVLGVRTPGKRYRPGTLLGELRPDRKRADLHPGARIRLYNDPRRTGIQLETGAEYWAFIEPSNPWDGVPGLIGGEGRTYIVFAARDP